ncbi:MAG TPA: hypothetical protein VNA25_02140 [Phycisphaerae bacterium]|jgi:hypothetical protein|nr:hypothetical protein [Phycisphaerae bacterium]
MSRRIKKFVLWLIAVAALLANALLLVRGLSKKETDDEGKKTQNPFLAGTAVASILAIVALLMKRHRKDDAHHEALYHCPVCDVQLLGRGRYCSECGSRV